jgi:hypothetical protein
MADAELPVDQRILRLFQHLGISRAHLAARMPLDWEGFVTKYPERVASLTLVCPSGVNPAALQPLGSRLLAIVADRGALADRVRRPLMQLTDAKIHALHDYAAQLWSDVIPDHFEDLGPCVLDFCPRKVRTRAPLRSRLPKAKAHTLGFSIEYAAPGSL